MYHLITRLAVGVAVMLLAPLAANALPILSEVYYDAVGSDDTLVFVELYGAPGTDLSGLVLEGVNGSNGSVGPVVTLSGVIPLDGLFVVADGDTGGTTAVANADLVTNFDFQNGPDSIVLRSGAVVLDAIGYGVFGPGEIFAGEGSPAPDPPAGMSLARVFADLDSNDNATDFVVAAPTPGTAPLSGVPEPGTAGSLGLGLAGLGCLGRLGRARHGA